MKPWLLESKHPVHGWIIDGRYATEDEARWRWRSTPSCYQRRVRYVEVNTLAACVADVIGPERTVVSEEFRRARGRVSR